MPICPIRNSSACSATSCKVLNALAAVVSTTALTALLYLQFPLHAFSSLAQPYQMCIIGVESSLAFTLLKELAVCILSKYDSKNAEEKKARLLSLKNALDALSTIVSLTALTTLFYLQFQLHAFSSLAQPHQMYIIGIESAIAFTFLKELAVRILKRNFSSKENPPETKKPEEETVLPLKEGEDCHEARPPSKAPPIEAEPRRTPTPPIMREPEEKEATLGPTLAYTEHLNTMHTAQFAQQLSQQQLRGEELMDTILQHITSMQQPPHSNLPAPASTPPDTPPRSCLSSPAPPLIEAEFREAFIPIAEPEEEETTPKPTLAYTEDFEVMQAMQDIYTEEFVQHLSQQQLSEEERTNAIFQHVSSIKKWFPSNLSNPAKTTPPDTPPQSRSTTPPIGEDPDHSPSPCDMSDWSFPSHVASSSSYPHSRSSSSTAGHVPLPRSRSPSPIPTAEHVPLPRSRSPSPIPSADVPLPHSRSPSPPPGPRADVDAMERKLLDTVERELSDFFSKLEGFLIAFFTHYNKGKQPSKAVIKRIQEGTTNTFNTIIRTLQDREKFKKLGFLSLCKYALKKRDKSVFKKIYETLNQPNANAEALKQVLVDYLNNLIQKDISSNESWPFLISLKETLKTLLDEIGPEYFVNQLLKTFNLSSHTEALAKLKPEMQTIVDITTNINSIFESLNSRLRLTDDPQALEALFQEEDIQRLQALLQEHFPDSEDLRDISSRFVKLIRDCQKKSFSIKKNIETNLYSLQQKILKAINTLPPYIESQATFIELMEQIFTENSSVEEGILSFRYDFLFRFLSHLSVLIKTKLGEFFSLLEEISEATPEDIIFYTDYDYKASGMREAVTKRATQGGTLLFTGNPIGRGLVKQVLKKAETWDTMNEGVNKLAVDEIMAEILRDFPPVFTKDEITSSLKPIIEALREPFFELNTNPRSKFKESLKGVIQQARKELPALQPPEGLSAIALFGFYLEAFTQRLQPTRNS